VPGLQLLTEPANLASQRVAERTGFRRTGSLPSSAEKDGHRVNHVVFALVADDRAGDNSVQLAFRFEAYKQSPAPTSPRSPALLGGRI